MSQNGRDLEALTVGGVSLLIRYVGKLSPRMGQGFAQENSSGLFPVPLPVVTMYEL